MVVGAAGWEGKFIVSALEERGWPVIARFTSRRTSTSRRATIQALDTSRVAAVDRDRLDRRRRSVPRSSDSCASGGGLVLAGPAASARNVASLAPGTIAHAHAPERASRPTRCGSGRPASIPSSLKDDGVALERRTDGIAVAARRVGAGRVMQVGYDDSWRWRMAGASGSERAHREWWSRDRRVGRVRAGASVASRRDDRRRARAAPLASLVDRLGPPRALASDSPSRRRSTGDWLIALMMLLLLAEWASRRLRGMR